MGGVLAGHQEAQPPKRKRIYLRHTRSLTIDRAAMRLLLAYPSIKSTEVVMLTTRVMASVLGQSADYQSNGSAGTKQRRTENSEISVDEVSVNDKRFSFHGMFGEISNSSCRQVYVLGDVVFGTDTHRPSLGTPEVLSLRFHAVSISKQHASHDRERG